MLAKCDITDEHKIWMSTGYRMLASSILLAILLLVMYSSLIEDIV